MDQTIQGSGNVTAGGNVTINVFIIAPVGFKKSADAPHVMMSTTFLIVPRIIISFSGSYCSTLHLLTSSADIRSL